MKKFPIAALAILIVICSFGQSNENSIVGDSDPCFGAKRKGKFCANEKCSHRTEDK